MQFFSQREYLKQLNIQRYYVNKFLINYANFTKITDYVYSYRCILDNEIERVKKDLNKKFNYNQTCIFDYIDKE